MAGSNNIVCHYGITVFKVLFAVLQDFFFDFFDFFDFPFISEILFATFS